jgi:outer membrane protein assembly factor BamB
MIRIPVSHNTISPLHPTYYSVVYALNPEDGAVIWSSQALEGACSGTPVLSEDGKYVFLTHNLVMVGHFTVLAASLNGVTFYSQLDPGQPYGPPGIYHNPLEGYYPGGTSNQNDVLIWAYRPTPTEEGVGSGQTLAFQFPIGFMDEAIGLGVTYISNVTWQAQTAPQIFNNGYSMMFAVSRSQFRVWNGGFGDTVNRFDKQATNNVDKARGDPVWQAVRAALTLSSDPLEPMAFGGAANAVFAGFDHLLNEMWQVETTFPIFAEARISPDDATVYCVEQNGRVHSVDVVTGAVRWSNSLGGVPVTSDFAMSKNGKYLYFANQAGILQAWQVADAPSPAPSPAPSSAPSIPTEQPSRNPDSPTVGPTVSPSLRTPSETPSVMPSGFDGTLDPTPATLTPTRAPTPNPASPAMQPVTNAPVPAPPTSGSYRQSSFMTLMVVATAGAWFL